MRVELPAPPFDSASLTCCFGFDVPAALGHAMNALCYDCRTGKEAYERLDQALGWLMAGDDQRYQQTPPELFPFAETGVDGGHLGYLIPAPELNLSDYPVARFEPMDGDGAYLVGPTTFEAIENELSCRLLWERDHEWPSAKSHSWWVAAEPKLAELGILPDVRKAEVASSPSIPVYVPEGWRHRPSSDGVGVLAPACAFGPSEPDVPLEDVGAALDWAARLNAEGFAATSLFLARECYWRVWASNAHDDARLCRLMIQSYRALGRPSLAEVLERRIKRYF